MPEQALRPTSPALPATKSELDNLLSFSKRRTIIDHVQDVNRLLWEDPEYQKYLKATFDEEAITGKVRFDWFVAAQMIKAKAREMGMVQLQDAKEGAIVKAIGRVLNRYEGLSLAERREQAEASQRSRQGSLLNEEGQEG
jgi:hypothetical protein